VLPCAKVARICNVTGRTVRNWLAAGRLAGIRRNGRFYVLSNSLEEFLGHDH
jgi:predicted site-specific integrase-resolvase